MPEPNQGTDLFIYKLTKKISPYLCDISPNIISVVGFLFIFPILSNLKNRRGYLELLILVFIRQFFDCLDGTVARKCDSESKFGAKLDVFLDSLSTIILIAFLIYTIINSKDHGKNDIIDPVLCHYLKIILVILLLRISVFIIYKAYRLIYYKYTLGEDIENSELLDLLHNNSTLFVIGVFLMIKIVI